MHMHPYYEIVYYIEGSGYGMIDRQRYEYAPGTFVFIPKDTPHSEYAATVSAHYLIGLTYNNEEFPVIPAGCYDDDVHKTLLALFKQIQRELKNSQFYYKRYVESLAEQILINIARRFVSRQDLTASKLKMAIAYINSYYYRDIDFADLAKSAYYSYDRFRHLFTEQIGVSPQRYLNNIRLDHAAKYLETTDHPVTEIAQKVGYHSDSALILDFKKRFGKTPAEYRKNPRGNRQSLQYADDVDPDKIPPPPDI